jgi:hypothetical protein
VIAVTGTGPEAAFSLDNDRLRFVSEYRALVACLGPADEQREKI